MTTGGLLATATESDAAVVSHGRASHDPRRWRTAAFAAARRALADSGPVDVIGIGALGAAPFLLDLKGEPVSDALLFSLDTRADAERDELGLTGDHALPKVRWLAARHSGAVRATDAGGWIAEQLTGRPTMDRVTRLAWTPELGLPLPIPDPVEPLSHAPLATDALGLPRGTPVVAGTLDSYVDVFAAGCTRPGDGCVLLGTTLVVYGVSRDPVAVDGLELQDYPGEGFLLGGSTSSGGNVLQWAGRTFGDAVDPRSCTGTLRVLPYLAGERTPVRDAGATGAILGITLTTTRAELHRAFVDAIALAALDHAERIARVVTVRRWRVTGGGVRNHAWLQATADALGVPLELAPLAGEGAGPAVFALAAMGAAPPADPSGSDRTRPRRRPPLCRLPRALPCPLPPPSRCPMTVAVVTGASSGIGQRQRRPLAPRPRRLRYVSLGRRGDVRCQPGDGGRLPGRDRRGPTAWSDRCPRLLGWHRLVRGEADLARAGRGLEAEPRDPPRRAVPSDPARVPGHDGRVAMVASWSCPRRRRRSAHRHRPPTAPRRRACSDWCARWRRTAPRSASPATRSSPAGSARPCPKQMPRSSRPARQVAVDEIWRERAASYAAGRTVDAAEVASVIGYLASDAASGISGESVRVALGGVW